MHVMVLMCGSFKLKPPKNLNCSFIWQFFAGLTLIDIKGVHFPGEPQEIVKVNSNNWQIRMLGVVVNVSSSIAVGIQCKKK